VNKQQLDVQVAENTRVKEELNKEQGDNESVRQGLIAKMDQLQTDNANQAQEIATMKNQLAMSKEEHDKRQGDLLRQLQVLRAQVEQKETVLDSKDGTVAFVDHSRGEIRSRDVTRRLGAREQMVFSVFDKDAPGLPTDKPKGTVQITQISEGGSVAKIVKTFDPLNPIRPGDQLYSAAWSPGSPKTFALIGKIDVDRDDRDDRADLKRLIEAAGGSVIYDLPPPGVGAESGELRPLTNWYVVDDRKPLRPPVDTAEERRTNEDEEAFNVKRTEALRSAWAMGIRPIAIESLLTWLGYTHRMRPFGRAEAVDRALVDELLFPGGRKGVLPGEEPAPSGDEMPAPDTEPAPDNAPAPDDRP
jgi:hypothetical protein